MNKQSFVSFTDESMQRELDKLIACTHCDALHSKVSLEDGQLVKCVRCGHVLMSVQDGSLLKVGLLNFAALILLAAAVFIPFIEIGAVGLENATSVFNAAIAFRMDDMLLLAWITAFSVLVIPFVRMLALVYTVLPVGLGFRPWKQAGNVFRVSERLRPWAMAEIFIIGVAVALVKVGDIANVYFEPGFWMFAAVVALNVWSELSLDTWTVWQSLDQNARHNMPQPEAKEDGPEIYAR